MDDNCGEWVECMGVASGSGEQEARMSSRHGNHQSSSYFGIQDQLR